MSSSLLIAIIDGDDSAREAASGLVRALGFGVAGYQDAAAFLATADVSQIACLITDMRMAGMSGLALHLHLRASSIFLPTILMTAYPEDATRERAERVGFVDYLSKPLASISRRGSAFRCLTHPPSGHSIARRQQRKRQ